MDAVMSNMVFHLVPPGALTAVGGELAGVLAPDGKLLWSSPDLGPPRSGAVLFHDANRALRARWLELVERGPDALFAPDAPSTYGHGSRAVVAAVALAAALDGDERRAAELRADRRILPRAHSVGQVTAALEEHLSGTVELRTYEMLDEEILDALLVPSNQAEFLGEIADSELRAEVIRTLMTGEVLPALRETGAGTSLGLGIQWTLGEFGSR
jgi:hypothetical protein